MEAGSPKLIRRLLGRTLLKALGWKAVPMLHKVPKAVIIMAPHSSTWDIIIGLIIKLATGAQFNWVGKKELFKGPLGEFFKYLGGLPLDREGTKNLVDAMIQEFQHRDRLLYGIAPEGSRSYRAHWRSGFYHIAVGAKVPIIFYYLDFKTKIGGCGPIFYPTGDIVQDMEEIRKFYANITPRNPKNCGPMTFAHEQAGDKDKTTLTISSHETFRVIGSKSQQGILLS